MGEIEPTSQSTSPLKVQSPASAYRSVQVGVPRQPDLRPGPGRDRLGAANEPALVLQLVDSAPRAGSASKCAERAARRRICCGLAQLAISFVTAVAVMSVRHASVLCGVPGCP